MIPSANAEGNILAHVLSNIRAELQSALHPNPPPLTSDRPRSPNRSGEATTWSYPRTSRTSPASAAAVVENCVGGRSRPEPSAERSRKLKRRRSRSRSSCASGDGVDTAPLSTSARATISNSDGDSTNVDRDNIRDHIGSSDVDVCARSVTDGEALDVLTQEDWDTVMLPMTELRPYLRSTTQPALSSSAELIESYVRCRCAELPMRLQSEALQLRQHEFAIGQDMKELIALSHFIAYSSPNPTSEAASGDGEGRRSLCSRTDTCSSSLNPHTQPKSSKDSPSIRGHDECCSEVRRRVDRCHARVEELEQSLRARARERVRCAQRMVLLSTMTQRLIHHLEQNEGKSHDA